MKKLHKYKDKRQRRSLLKILDALHDHFEGLGYEELKRITNLADDTLSRNKKEAETNRWISNEYPDGRYRILPEGTRALLDFYREACYQSNISEDEVEYGPVIARIEDIEVQTMQGQFNLGSGMIQCYTEYPTEIDGKILEDLGKKIGEYAAEALGRNMKCPIHKFKVIIYAERVDGKLVNKPKVTLDVNTKMDKQDNRGPSGTWLESSPPLTVWEEGHGGYSDGLLDDCHIQSNTMLLEKDKGKAKLPMKANRNPNNVKRIDSKIVETKLKNSKEISNEE